MDFTNINDPAGVKALLDQLRSSQAWQDSIAALPNNSQFANGTGHVSDPPFIPSTQEHASSTSGSTLSDGQVPVAPVIPPSATSSVASLLSQLQTSSTYSSVIAAPNPANINITSESNITSALNLPPVHDRQTPSAKPGPVFTPTDVRSLTFQQALPHLVKLSGDSGFVASIAQLRDQQAELERQLWEERRAIQRKYEEKVKVARTKAAMIGGGISKHEADMIADAFRRELHKFDSDRVLPAWDGLITKQQATLEELGVPIMFSTSAANDREKQQRVIQVLEGIAGNDGH